jgi:hypothetical protein
MFFKILENLSNVIKPAEPAGILERLHGYLPVDVKTTDIQNMFPLLVSGIFLTICLLMVGKVLHFTMEKLAIASWKVAKRLFLMLLEIPNFFLKIWEHLGELMPEIATFLGILLVVVVASHVLFVLYIVNSYAQLHPDICFQIWGLFAAGYSSIVINAVTYCNTPRGMSVLAKILNVIFPELVQSNLLNLEAPTPKPA